MSQAAALERLLRPQSVAVVGASDTSTMSQTMASLVEHEVQAYFVNPKHSHVFGVPTHASLADLPAPVDAVVSLLSAESSVRVAEQAADLGAGGLVLVASGFAELGAEGAELQRRLAAAAERGGMAVVGPNGVGFLDANRGLELTFLPRFDRRPGGVSVVAHSGALLEAFAASSHRAGGVGLNLLISAGNEAVTDLADYLDYLVSDDATKVIVMAVEKIRRPGPFFAAAARARQAGKPIVALKLARSDRSRQLALSHTGTVTGDAWVYDVAFAQAGIAIAHEVDELVDRVQFLEQLPRQKWTEVRGLAVLTGTGGFASMAADLALTEHVDVPEVERLDRWVGGVVPGATCANPLDVTGFVLSRGEIWEQVVDTYAAAPEFDAYIFLSQFADWDTRSRRFSDRFAEISARSEQPFLVSPLAGQAGAWVDEYRAEHGVAVGNGLRGTLRGLNTMASFMRSRPDLAVRSADEVAPMPAPAERVVSESGAPMLPFASAMGLLADAGIEVSPFHLVHGLDELDAIPFAAPYVLKLADVAHRTEVGGVVVGVEKDDLSAAVKRLRDIAARHGLPSVIAVQPLVEGHGEVFVGLTGASELGPVVAFGPGGVFVEVMRRVSGRIAPFTTADALDLIAEFDDTGLPDGVRGRPGWDREALAELLVRAGQLVAAGRQWIQSMDVNPLIVTPSGFVAVDACCFVDQS